MSYKCQILKGERSEYANESSSRFGVSDIFIVSFLATRRPRRTTVRRLDRRRRGNGAGLSATASDWSGRAHSDRARTRTGSKTLLGVVVSGGARQLGAGLQADTSINLPEARRTLVVAGAAHALHDGFTDLIYVLLPVWQAEFGLAYTTLAVLRALYTSAMALLQIPSGRVAERRDGRVLLAFGTALA